MQRGKLRDVFAFNGRDHIIICSLYAQVSQISPVMNTCFISFILTFQFCSPMVTHCALPILSHSPLSWALLEQSFAEQSNLFPAEATELRLFCQHLTTTVTVHSSERGELTRPKNSSQQGPRDKFLIPKNSFHTPPLPCKFRTAKKEPPQGKWSWFSGQHGSLQVGSEVKHSKVTLTKQQPFDA